jgi:hypothetical protein
MLIYRTDDEAVALARSIAPGIKAAALAAAPSFQREHSYRARCAELLRVVGA